MPESSGSICAVGDRVERSSSGSAVVCPVVRPIYIVLGLMLTGLGVLGAIVPGLPATVFLIGAMYCLTRSSPAMTARVCRIRVLGPYLRMLEPGSVMPMRARVISLSTMWVSISLSTLVLYRAYGDGAVVLMGLAGAVGTVGILRFRRGARTGEAYRVRCAAE